MITIDKNRFNSIINKFRHKKVLIIGDLMLDEYIIGHVERISPEAPVPVLYISQEQTKFGGSANVAFNIKKLSGQPILAGITGEDKAGRKLISMLQENGISADGIITANDRLTTVKSRVIGHSQHMIRLDRETTGFIDQKTEKKLLQAINSILPEVSAIIFQDYNKGTLTENLISSTITKAISQNVPVFADPKFLNFLNYKNITLFKPNIKETEEALAVKIKNETDLIQSGKHLLSHLASGSVLITRGAGGMTLFEKNGDITHVASKVRNVADVSGAGDTVIATASLAFIGGATLKEAATIANYAAGIVCEEVGIVPVKLDKLKKACCENNSK